MALNWEGWGTPYFTLTSCGKINKYSTKSLRSFVYNCLFSSIVNFTNDHDGFINENGIKAKGLEGQNNNFHCASRFLYISYHHCTTTMKGCLISHFVEDANTRRRLSSSFSELGYCLLEFNSKRE